MVCNRLPGRHIPIRKESTLQTAYGIPHDAHMRIAPYRLVCIHLIKITLCQIHAAHIAYNTVDDHNLPMIPEIHLTGKLRKTHRKESRHLYTLRFHLLEKAILHVPTSHVVVHQPDAHPLTGFGRQSLAHQSSHLVIFYDIEFHMDMMPRRGNVAQEVIEHLLSGNEETYFIVGIRK